MLGLLQPHTSFRTALRWLETVVVTKRGSAITARCGTAHAAAGVHIGADANAGGWEHRWYGCCQRVRSGSCCRGALFRDALLLPHAGADGSGAGAVEEHAVALSCPM